MTLMALKDITPEEVNIYENANPKITPTEMISASFVCTYLLTLLTNVSMEANSVDPDQTAPIGAV